MTASRSRKRCWHKASWKPRDAVQQLLDDAEETGHGSFVIWSLILQALILHAQADRTAAHSSLQRALALAEPHGCRSKRPTHFRHIWMPCSARSVPDGRPALARRPAGALPDSGARHARPRWSAWFDQLVISHDAEGNTLLAGPVSDQAALYSLINRLRDLGMTLLAVARDR